MFRSLLRGLFCAPMLTLLLMCASPAQAKRVALVIGNDHYENIPNLKKAVNDARAVGDTLKDLGFELSTAENLSQREMIRKLQEFANKIGRDDEALFFFAGHGIQISGQNFLLPTDIPDAKPNQAAFVRYQAVGVHQVLDIIRGRGSRVSIVVIDACRNNPFRREGTRTLGGTRGLASMAPPEGSFVMYSAGAGQEALDTLGDDDPHPNSIFARTLIPFMKTPGLKLPEMARRVRSQVQKLAATVPHHQRPAYYDEVTGEFFFTPSGVEASAPSRFSTSKSPHEALWASIKGSNRVPDFEFYLRRFPKGLYSAVAELKVKQLIEKKAAEGGDPKAAKAERVRRKREAAKAERARRKREAAKAERVRREREAAKAERARRKREAAKAERVRREREAAKAEQVRREQEAAKAERVQSEQEAAKAERVQREQEAAKAEQVRREQQKKQEEQRTQYAAIDAKSQAETDVSLLVPTELKSEVPKDVKSHVPTGLGRANYLKQVQTTLKGYNCYSGNVNGDLDDARGALKRFATSYQGTVSPLNLTSATIEDYEDWLSWSEGLEKFSCPSEKRRTVGDQKRRKKVKTPTKSRKKKVRQTKRKRVRPKRKARSTARRQPRRQQRRPSSGSTMTGVGF